MCDVTDMPVFLNDPQNIGEAAVTALASGCDMIQIYHNQSTQIKGILAIHEAVEKGIIRKEDICRSTELILGLKKHYLSWRTALAAPNPQKLQDLMQHHTALSRKAYENSLTVVRDENNLIPLSSRIAHKDEVLLLTPIVRPLHHRAPGEPTVDPFEVFGKALARRHPHITQAPYTAHGVTQTHVALIKRCAAVIFVTVNAARSNGVSQIETAGAVRRLCYSKPMISLAACDPYDLLADRRCM